MARRAKSDAPLVTICVASFNAERHLEAAIRSALSQTLDDLEVIVVDDASSDGSVALAKAISREDPRVRVEALAKNEGPGGARNRGIELARGQWFAVLDADDLYHPERLERLLAEAAATGADAVADDLLVFDDDGPACDRRRFLTRRRLGAPSWITPADYFDETRMFESRANLGFLKPVISVDALRRMGVLYDPALRIGEDDDLIVRLLKAGLKYRLYPSLTYFYRKHEASISHRIGVGHLDQMLERAAAMQREWAGAPLAATAALARREASFRSAHAFGCMVDALKARRLFTALGVGLRHPAALKHFGMPLGARIRRLVPARARVAEPPSAAIVSRQRVIGSTNGSSAYLLSLAGAVAAAGLRPRLITPSPVMFGRWPVLKLKPEMHIFDRIIVRGGVRFRDLIISTEPRRYWSAARAILGRALAKLGLSWAAIEGEKAPYAIAAPWTDADRLFVARNAPTNLGAMIADYAFLTEAFPYLIAPSVPSAVIMHDLFHARAESLESQKAADGVAVLSEPEERRLLAKADAVIAIQKTEAAYIRKALPKSQAIVAPMAVEPADSVQVGRDGHALFVGSSTHPNVVGLQWLFDAVWPLVRKACPEARLAVAGSVDRAFAAAPKGVEFLGVVPDLASLYQDAGVVISPLIVGSGLKIKLVEAMAAGKAIVATGVTLQGVEQEAGPGVRQANDAEAFAAAMVELMGDATARLRLAERALKIAGEAFGPATAYADLRAWISSRARQT